MPISKKQLQRLIRLVSQLKENRYPNCSTFAAAMRKADLDENLNVACTPKTIFRDIQTLKNDFDAPIKFDKVRNGYYLAHHGWNFSCPQIYDDSEMLAAVLGARVAEHIFPPAMRDQIRKAVDYLLTYNNPDFLDKTQMDSLVVIPSNRTCIDTDIFTPLFQAWQNHLVCNISYVDSLGQMTERLFEPHTLVFFDGNWYTKGFCHKRQDWRTLVVARIMSVYQTGKEFIPNPKIISSSTEDFLFNTERVTNVVVRCDEFLHNIVKTRPLHPKQKIVPISDGGCKLYIDSMSKYYLHSWIMHQCGRATLEKPLDVARDIEHFAEKILKSHSNIKLEKENV